MMSSTEKAKLDRMIIVYRYSARVGVEVMREKKKVQGKKNRQDLGASSENEK
jgi:hypothetical protein